jgi:hypothetical protein
MSLVVRLFTLLTIATAGFALPMTCAQNGAASEPASIEIPADQQLSPHDALTAPLTDERQDAHSLTERLLDKLPFDCGDKATPHATEHPATFDTEPFVPGYLVSNVLLDEQRDENFALPPPLIPVDSRAGPPDAPPPKSID